MCIFAATIIQDRKTLQIITLEVFQREVGGTIRVRNTCKGRFIYYTSHGFDGRVHATNVFAVVLTGYQSVVVIKYLLIDMKLLSHRIFLRMSLSGIMIKMMINSPLKR